MRPYVVPRLRFATCGIFAAISDPEKHRVFENTCRLRAEKSARHLRGKKNTCHLRQ